MTNFGKFFFALNPSEIATKSKKENSGNFQQKTNSNLLLWVQTPSTSHYYL
jgi:hypothetical protein